ncbi:MAG: hypothetical protein WDZ64_00545 [Parcubacteria group bacterium]
MQKKDLILISVLALAIFGWGLHFLAGFFYLYWSVWWFDVLMHFMVSFTGGLGIYWGFFYSGLFFRQEFENRAMAILLVFVCVMIVGVGWEIFEYVYGLTDAPEGHKLDTIFDLIFDSLGALLAGFLVTRKNIND